MQPELDVFVQWMVTWTKLNQKTIIHFLFRPSHYQQLKPKIMAMLPQSTRVTTTLRVRKRRFVLCPVTLDGGFVLAGDVIQHLLRLDVWDHDKTWINNENSRLIMWCIDEDDSERPEQVWLSQRCIFVLFGVFFFIYLPSNGTFWSTFHEASQ